MALARFFAFCLVWICGAAPSQANPASEIDDIVQRTILRYQSQPGSGYSVGVLFQGKIILLKGYGFSDRSQAAPITPSTRFFVGSNTKSFTALGLAILGDRGLVNFEKPLQTDWPTFSLKDPAVSTQVSIADLLSHRTGLPRHDFLWEFTDLSRSEILARLPHLDMDYRPENGFRKSFQYNNLMYMAAGQIIENKTGLTWEEFTEREILQPLEMSESGVHFLNPPNIAIPYTSTGEVLGFPLRQSAGPAGSIYSTPGDMLKYLNLYLNLGKLPNGLKLVSENALLNLFWPRNDSKDRHLISGAIWTRYGMGWWVDFDGTNHVAYHGGGISGFRSQMAFDQANQIAVVVLSNQRADPAVDPITRAIFDVLHQKQSKPVGLPQALAPLPIEMDSLGSGRPNEGQYNILSRARSLNLSATVLGSFFHSGYGQIDLVTDGKYVYFKWYDNYWPIVGYQDPFTYYLVYSSAITPFVLPAFFEKDSRQSVIGLYPAFEVYALCRFQRTL